MGKLYRERRDQNKGRQPHPWLALIARPATTLLKVFEATTFCAPKMRPNIRVKAGIFDEPPVLTTASIWPGRNPEAAAKIQTTMILAVAFTEAIAIYALVVALIIKFV